MSNQGNNAPGGFIVKAITGATVAAASYVVFRYFTRTFESAPPIQSNASTLPISLQNLEHNIPISKTGTELPWLILYLQSNPQESNSDLLSNFLQSKGHETHQITIENTEIPSKFPTVDLAYPTFQYGQARYCSENLPFLKSGVEKMLASTAAEDYEAFELENNPWADPEKTLSAYAGVVLTSDSKGFLHFSKTHHNVTYLSKFLRQIIRSDIPLLSLHGGSHALVHALGGHCIASPLPELGVVSLCMTTRNPHDSLFSAFSTPLPASPMLDQSKSKSTDPSNLLSELIVENTPLLPSPEKTLSLSFLSHQFGMVLKPEGLEILAMTDSLNENPAGSRGLCFSQALRARMSLVVFFNPDLAPETYLDWISEENTTMSKNIKPESIQEARACVEKNQDVLLKSSLHFFELWYNDVKARSKYLSYWQSAELDTLENERRGAMLVEPTTIEDID